MVICYFSAVPLFLLCRGTAWCKQNIDFNCHRMLLNCVECLNRNHTVNFVDNTIIIVASEQSFFLPDKVDDMFVYVIDNVTMLLDVGNVDLNREDVSCTICDFYCGSYASTDTPSLQLMYFCLY
jgi:hypothetical protein